MHRLKMKVKKKSTGCKWFGQNIYIHGKDHFLEWPWDEYSILVFFFFYFLYPNVKEGNWYFCYKPLYRGVYIKEKIIETKTNFSC